MKKKQLFLVIILMLSLIVPMDHNIIFAKELSNYDITVTGIQKAYIISDEGGPGVSKTIITLDQTIDTKSVNANQFKVKEIKDGIVFEYDQEGNIASMKNGEVSKDRKVLAAYTSDNQGKMVDTDSNYLTIEMYTSPDDGSPIYYNVGEGHNKWCENYNLSISLINEKPLMTADNEIISELKIQENINVLEKSTQKVCPVLEGFETGVYNGKKRDISYASWAPKTDSQKNPLVIWLHGAGEGGNQPTISVIANEVSALVGEEFQSEFDGAYILAPQSPTMWMDGGNNNYQVGNSIYADDLFALIEEYVKTNNDIDPNRIIIGGCSNGGYMTMEMILKHPDYFAAAYPICEAYEDSAITDEQIESIKDLPIWFTYAKNDTTVDPNKNAIPTIKRLINAGAKNIHVSEFENVVSSIYNETSGLLELEGGKPKEYDGHWSWIYFFNNQCVDGELTAWSFLGQQAKKISNELVKDKSNNEVVKSNKSVATGDDIITFGFGGLALISSLIILALMKKKS